MSSILYSAKYFSKEDEEKENETLTDAEREARLDDMYGIGNDADSSDDDDDDGDDDADITDELLEFFDLALEEIPVQDKIDCLWAIEEASLVYESESNPRMFLRCENYEAPLIKVKPINLVLKCNRPCQEETMAFKSRR